MFRRAVSNLLSNALRYTPEVFMTSPSVSPVTAINHDRLENTNRHRCQDPAPVVRPLLTEPDASRPIRT